jgi:hypothetical protein
MPVNQSSSVDGEMREEGVPRLRVRGISRVRETSPGETGGQPVWSSSYKASVQWRSDHADRKREQLHGVLTGGAWLTG